MLPVPTETCRDAAYSGQSTTGGAAATICSTANLFFFTAKPSFFRSNFGEN